MSFNVSKAGKSLENIVQSTSKKVLKKDAVPIQKTVKQGGLKLLSSLESMGLNAQAAIKKNIGNAADIAKAAKNKAIGLEINRKVEKFSPDAAEYIKSMPADSYQEVINAKRALNSATGKKAHKSAFESAQAIIKEQRLNPLSNKSAKESARTFELYGKSNFEKELDKAESLAKQAKLKVKLQDELAPKIKIKETKARLLEKYNK